MNLPKNVATASSRITVIDAMRGIALIGICLTHAMQNFGAYPFAPSVEPYPWLEPVNEIAREFIRYFVAAKFYILFSFLFGLSFFIQMDRAAQKGIDFRPRFLWRLALLLVIGLLHSLFFPLDILIIYAILGFPLVFLYPLRSKVLLGLALFFLLGGVQLGMAGYKALAISPLQAESAEAIPPRQHLNRGRTAPATFEEMMYQNATMRLKEKFNYQVQSGRGFMTLGVFILGLLAGRVRLFHQLEAYRKKLYQGAGIAATLLLLLYLIQPYLPGGRPDTLRSWMAMPVTNLINLATAYVWMVFIVWIYSWRKVRDKLAPLVDYGRMGLTNYIVQSVAGVCIFYSPGLGLSQQAGTLTAMAVCTAYTFLQIRGSRYWLKHFRYGPLEWVWRSGTYTRWQPLKKAKVAV